MKILLTTLLVLLSVPSFAHHRNPPPAVEEARNVSRSQNWRYNQYFEGTREFGVRGAHDVWTTVGDRSFVLSCAIERVTGKRSFRIFIATNTPIHKFAEPVTVTMTIGDDTFTLNGKVSEVYVGNVHVMLPTEPNELFDRMRSGRRFSIEIPVVSGVYYMRQEFSLMGFNKASLNTITNCTL